MTMATFTYLAYAPIGFGLPLQTSCIVAALGTLVCIALFMKRVRRLSRATFAVDEHADAFGAGEEGQTLSTAAK